MIVHVHTERLAFKLSRKSRNFVEWANDVIIHIENGKTELQLQRQKGKIQEHKEGVELSIPRSFNFERMTICIIFCFILSNKQISCRVPSITSV